VIDTSLNTPQVQDKEGDVLGKQSNTILKLTKEFNRKWNRLKSERKSNDLRAIKKDREYSKKQDLLMRKYAKLIDKQVKKERKLRKVM